MGLHPSSLVFKAKKVGSENTFAVKTLKTEEIARNNTTFLRFKREIETLQKLDNSNIVKILDYGL